MTDPTPASDAQPAQPGTAQVHPLAALQEASYDNEVHRNRRLILANDIYLLNQMVAERDARIAELEKRLATYEPAEADKQVEPAKPTKPAKEAR